jgi:Ran GTPase-activating protein (RanGAP) involved in mRNA processing and transport
MASLCGLHQGQTEADFSNQGLGAEDAKLIASDIQDMGSLSKLDLSKNDLRSEGLSTVSEALKSTSIKQLNIAENRLTLNTQGHIDMSGVIKFTGDMKDMGSLSKLNISHNQLCGNWRSPDFTGFKALVSAIEQHKTLAMSSVDMAEELDVSGQKLGPKDAQQLAGFVKANGSLSKLNLAHTQIGGIRASRGALAALLKTNTTLLELNIASNSINSTDAGILAPGLEATRDFGCKTWSVTLVVCVL